MTRHWQLGHKSFIFYNNCRKLSYHLRTGKPPPQCWSPGNQRRRCWLTGSWSAAQHGTYGAPLSANAPGESHRQSWICWSKTSRRKTDQQREENPGSLKSKQQGRSWEFLFCWHVSDKRLISILQSLTSFQIWSYCLKLGYIWTGILIYNKTNNISHHHRFLLWR